MHFNVNDESKILSVWITKEESVNNELSIELEEIIAKYKAKKYRICIYKSGTNDFKKDILNLILNNVKI